MSPAEQEDAIERRRRLSDPAVILGVLVLVVGALGIFGLIAAQGDAAEALRQTQELQLRADARTFEALLAQQYGRLEFLLDQLTGPAADHASAPMSRLWERINLEGTLLRYLDTNPPVVRLRVSANDAARALAERDEGVPVLRDPSSRLPLELELLHGEWANEEGVRLEAWVDPRRVLADLGDGLGLTATRPEPGGGSTAPVAGAGELVEPVTSSFWTRPLEAVVVQQPGGVGSPLDSVTGWFRVFLWLQLVLLPAALVLALLTARRLRRIARLETEGRQARRLAALERQVEHSERLASLGRFAAGIAHEMNNPLEGMKNYTRLLSEDLAGERLEDLEQPRIWLQRIDEGIERAAGAVRQLLDFAQPSAAGGRFASLELAALLEETRRFVSAHPDCSGAVVEIECDPGLTVFGDRQTLGQLVLNLTLNACQAQVDGGAPKRVRFVAAPADRDGRVRLEVLDWGTGFTEDGLQHAFEPFHSSRGSRGLGLSVCHSIVRAHGGMIELTNRADGGGARVEVVLPSRAGSQEPGSP